MRTMQSILSAHAIAMLASAPTRTQEEEKANIKADLDPFGVYAASEEDIRSAMHDRDNPYADVELRLLWHASGYTEYAERVDAHSRLPAQVQDSLNADLRAAAKGMGFASSGPNRKARRAERFGRKVQP